MSNNDAKITEAVREAHRIGDLADLSTWMMDNIPGPFRFMPEVHGPKNGLPVMARLSSVKFSNPTYVRTMQHHWAKDFSGLPIGPPGEQVPILGMRVAFTCTTEGGNWWNPSILVRLGMFPSVWMKKPPGTRTRRVFAYTIIMRGEEWPALVVMHRLASP